MTILELHAAEVDEVLGEGTAAATFLMPYLETLHRVPPEMGPSMVSELWEAHHEEGGEDEHEWHRYREEEEEEEWDEEESDYYHGHEEL